MLFFDFSVPLDDLDRSPDEAFGTFLAVILIWVYLTLSCLIHPRIDHYVFLEDKLHDWNVNKKENLLHYGSRVVEQGENIKILVEYEDK